MQQRSLILVGLVATGCLGDEPASDVTIAETDQALSTPEVGYYCSAVYPATNGWTLNWGGNV